MRALQERLVAERNFSETMLDAAGCLVVVLDPAGRVVRWNRACEQLTGYPAAVLATAEDVVHLLVAPEDGAGTLRVLTELRDGRPGIVSYLNRWRTRSGELRLITWCNTAVVIDGTRHVISSGIDITDVEQARQALEISEAWFRLLAEAAPDMIYRCRLSPDRAFEYVSPAALALTGYPPQAFYADPQLMLGVTHPDDRALLRLAETDFGRPASAPLRLRWIHQDGSIHWVEDHNVVIRNPAGAVVALEGVVRDVTEQVRVEHLLGHQSRVLELIAQGHLLPETLDLLLRLLEDHLPGLLGMLVVRDDATQPGRLAAIPQVPDALRAEVELRAMEPVGTFRDARALPLHSADEALLPEVVRAAAADRQLTSVWRAPLRSAASEALGDLLVFAPSELQQNAIDALGIFARLAVVAVERDRDERALSHQATHDPLTGLANRTLLLSHLETALYRTRRGPEGLAVLFCDLDRFKNVNDSLGHSAGDALLVAVAARLRATVRPEDMVARPGGDEFVIVSEGPIEGNFAARMADRVLGAFDAPFEVADRRLYISPSVGIAVAGSASDSAEGLVRNADAAMYRAKQRGRHRVEMFDAAMQRRAQRRWETETALHASLTDSELDVYYQPQFDLGDGRVVGAEALLRWRHDGRMIPPAEFIPLAEESGLIVRLGNWVLEQACRAAIRFTAARPGFVVSVNLSARQLTDAGLRDSVDGVLRATGLAPEQLCLEVTETVLMDDASALLDTLLGLRQLGVTFAIDDFGTGYSSLLYLKRLPVTTLKIDGQFVGGLGIDDDDEAIVASTIQLARALNLTTVAEGVETEQQRDRLVALDCEYAQGYFFGRPGSAEALEALVAS